MADAKKMTVTGADTTVLTPGAASKFASAGTPGRVLNFDASTDGGGTAKIWLEHPDGTLEERASVVIPKLAAGEKMSLGVRVCAGIRKKAAAAEIG